MCGVPNTNINFTMVNNVTNICLNYNIIITFFILWNETGIVTKIKKKKNLLKSDK